MKRRYRNPGMSKIMKYGLVAGGVYLVLKNRKPAAAPVTQQAATVDRPAAR